MGSKPKPPPPPPPPPAPAPPPTPVARRPIARAATPSTRKTSASIFGSVSRVPRRKTEQTSKRTQGRSPLGGGSGMYGG